MDDIIRFDNSRITFRNFSGAESKFNRAGDRNFAIIIDDEEVANDLIEQGLNVKIRPPREEGDTPFMYLSVKVKFNDRPELARLNPNIYLKSGDSMVKLTEETVSCLDSIEIENVDMDIKIRNWEVGGKVGKSAYLRGMCVTQRLDRFDAVYSKYNREAPINDDIPF